MNLTYSRSYFGPNQHADSAAVYLAITLDAKERELLTDPDSDIWNQVDGLSSRYPESMDATGNLLRLTQVLRNSAKHGVIAMMETAVRQAAVMVGEPVSSIEVIPGHAPNSIEMVIRCADTEILRRAGIWAVKCLNFLPELSVITYEQIKNFQNDLAELRRFASSRRATPTEAAVLAAAAEREIPVIRFDRWPFAPDDAPVPSERKGLVQLGIGIHGRRLRGSATAAVPPQTHELLDDRRQAHAALRDGGIPVPERDNEFPNVNTARRAVRSARRLGFPVVLKPQCSPRGLGVSINLSSDEAVVSACHAASRYDRHLVIERQIPGELYHLLVVGGEVVAARRKSPEPAAAIAVDSVNLGAALKATARRAAECFGLDVAGVDIVTPDPPGSPGTSGHAVIRVDPAPDLALHLTGEESIPLTAARRFLARLFPDGAPTRIPVAAVTGTNGKTTTCRMAARIFETAGYTTGLACSDGVYIGGDLINPGVFSGISGALQVFKDPRVELAVLEVSRGTLTRKGLGFDQATVGTCTNVDADHIGLDGIETVAAMARLKRVVVQRATKLAIVNAKDPLCLEMLPHTNAKRTCLVSTDAAREEVISNLAAGGLAVVLGAGAQGPLIEVRDGSVTKPVIPVSDIPATWDGAALHNIENAMFATAIAVGLGVEPDVIRRALASFEASLADSPGRINRYEELPFDVIVDKSATAPAYRALCDFVDRLPPHHCRFLVFHGVGDRRDSDLRAIAKRAAQSFDRYVCYDFEELRGRPAGEVPALLESALREQGVTPDRITLCTSKKEAIFQALGAAKAGDLVVIGAGFKAYNKIFDWLDDFASSSVNFEELCQ